MTATGIDDTTPTPAKPSQSWLWGWSLLGAGAFLHMFITYYMPVGRGIDVSGQLIGHDFVNVWTGARMALAQNASKIFSVAPYMDEMHRILWKDEPFHAFSYPPHILPLLLAFGLLPFFPALAAWTVGGIAVFQSSVLSHLGSKVDKISAALLLLMSPAAVVNILLGQNGFFTAGLFLGGLYLSERRPKTGGFLIGLLTVKPQLGLLVPLVLLLRRNWICFASAAVTTLALGALSVCIWGIEPWENFIRVTVPLQVSLIMENKGFYIYMMPAIYTSVLGFDNPSTALRASWVILHLIAAFWAAFVALRAVRRDGINDTTVFMLSIATLLLPMYCFNYDMAMISAALLIYAMQRKNIPIIGCFFLGLVWILPTATIPIKVAGLSPLPGIVLIAALAYVERQRAAASGMTAVHNV